MRLIVISLSLHWLIRQFDFISMVSGFSWTTGKNALFAKPYVRSSTTTLYAITDDGIENSKDAMTTTSTKATAMTPDLYIPLSLDEMVKQTSAAMEDAMLKGKKRQIVRILLPRSSDNDQLLQYYESNVISEDGTPLTLETKLCPTDETWQGGIMQLYRAASLACQKILRCVVHVVVVLPFVCRNLSSKQSYMFPSSHQPVFKKC
jgi:hypothetical protein